ncbi:uncharacterized protein L969DRAFT_91275 [Mixia osmundae IAM 14324]|uniref:BSD domain-containing protein n=1 Tax=Mixia osmundae (strain CBS 9802 / IAM 14324 / JCM 22182 / KY 12970) TaxID=764103 RepID=G7DSQ1_MIXOS|nr:uncharacterized protein L969DRAFT_91275 [Mixia osmundae IAM 14324]KEI41792.1 hypothetical protein L969DRAFT_91275 [Mixia osmundae IAM 14324]GAA93609.1 hypothetical protein E5Q_00253 [Mixia osmundae IAM 14324]
MDLTDGLYDARSTADSTPTPDRQQDQQASTGVVNLDEELKNLAVGLGSVGQSLGSFWGSFKKQGAAAYEATQRELNQRTEAARKDLTPLISKAREELGKIGEQALATASAGQASSNEDKDDDTRTQTDDGSPGEQLATPVSKGKERELDAVGPVPAIAQEDASFTYSTLDGVIISTRPEANATAPELDLAPAIASTQKFFASIQAQIQANSNVAAISKAVPNLTQLQAQLEKLPLQVQEQLHKLPIENSTKIAEGYLQKGEAYFTKAGKEIGDLLKDAVKVVPPSEADQRAAREAAWQSKGGMVAARTDSLLHRLRSDPNVFLVDPAQPAVSIQVTDTAGQHAAPAADSAARQREATSSESRMLYARFLQELEDKGGFESSFWKDQIAAELARPRGEGALLQGSFEAVVPSRITAEAFWARYFFRVRQIEVDEAKRKQVLADAKSQEEEDFSWDNDEDEDAEAAAPATTAKPAVPAHQDSNVSAGQASSASDDESWGAESPSQERAPDVLPLKPSAIRAIASRESSEEGSSTYDIVSRTSGQVSANEDTRAVPAKTEDDEDSDWE